mmetsp:Transcript_10090/g.29917  ORF Transcript_10090/g.29917 Transcript_10090/m.29917 type:complete len:392 (-) Transcript_10090:23-1198(-)
MMAWTDWTSGCASTIMRQACSARSIRRACRCCRAAWCCSRTRRPSTPSRSACRASGSPSASLRPSTPRRGSGKAHTRTTPIVRAAPSRRSTPRRWETSTLPTSSRRITATAAAPSGSRCTRQPMAAAAAVGTACGWAPASRPGGRRSATRQRSSQRRGTRRSSRRRRAFTCTSTTPWAASAATLAGRVPSVHRTVSRRARTAGRWSCGPLASCRRCGAPPTSHLIGACRSVRPCFRLGAARPCTSRSAARGASLSVSRACPALSVHSCCWWRCWWRCSRTPWRRRAVALEGARRAPCAVRGSTVAIADLFSDTVCVSCVSRWSDRANTALCATEIDELATWRGRMRTCVSTEGCRNDVVFEPARQAQTSEFDERIITTINMPCRRGHGTSV